jgi:hypothetical protein
MVLISIGGNANAEPSPAFRFVSAYEEPCAIDKGHRCDDQELLQFAVDDAARVGAILYVDGKYTLYDTLTLRKMSTLRGDSPNGGDIGTILFEPTSGYRAMLAVDPKNIGKSDVVISDLYFEAIGDQRPSVAIDLSKHSGIHLNRLQIALFDIGLYGDESLSIWVNDCIIRNSKISGYVLTQGSNAWRIRGGIASQSELYGALILDSRDVLIDGVRMESNGIAAIWTNGQNSNLTNNYFEGNGGGNRTAVIIEVDATDTRLAGNYLGRNGTISQADDQLVWDRGRDTIQLDARRDLLWPGDVEIAGSLHLKRLRDVVSTGITFTGERGQWALRHLPSGDLALSRFGLASSFKDIPFRVDHANGSVLIGTDLQVGSSSPKICGGYGRPPNAASKSCDSLNGSMYLDSKDEGGAYLRISGSWRRVMTE